MKRYGIILLLFTFWGVGLFLLPQTFGGGVNDNLRKTKDKIKNVKLDCPRNCEELVERWGLSGYAKYCVKDAVRHGKWIAFENDKVVIEGQYNQDKKDGYWIWYHKTGRVFRIVEYDRGLEIRDTIINKDP